MNQGGPVNVLLISIDTVRADHTSLNGYERETTPTLAALAKQGVRFAAAYAPTATTAPSHASLFTSLYPPTHRVIKNGRTLADEHETLAEVLTRWGYQCGAVVSSFVLNHKFNFDQGFDSWDDDFSQAISPEGVRAWEGRRIEAKFYGRADDTTRRAIAWLEARADDKPFFLFVHYYDPHDPYDPPPGFRERFQPPTKGRSPRSLESIIASYDGEIAYTDQEIGRLLDALDSLGLTDETLVVATGDHGEGLMEHSHLTHGVHIYEEAVRVPLVMRWPGQIAAGRSVSIPVELTDVAPTILELVSPGVGALPGRGAEAARWDELMRDEAGAARGRSLAPLLSSSVETLDETAIRPVFFYRRHYDGAMVGLVWAEGEKFGLRDGRWKYIRGNAAQSGELYDLEADPGERDDLSARLPEIARRLSQTLDEWRRSVSREDPATESLPAEDRAKLEALGYVD